MFVSSCEDNYAEPIGIYEYTFTYRVYETNVYLNAVKGITRNDYNIFFEDVKITDYYPLTLEDIDYYRTNHPNCNYYYRSDTVRNLDPFMDPFSHHYKITTIEKEYHSYTVK
jgi:hypothetical protein